MPAKEAGTMAESLSVDLRERVVAAIEGGMSRRQAAVHFRVGVSSAIRWMARARDTGDVRPKSMGGDHRSAPMEAQAQFLLSMRQARSDATLREYQAELAERGLSIGVSSIWRIFRQARDQAQKKTAHAWRAATAELPREKGCAPPSRSAIGRRRPLSLACASTGSWPLSFSMAP
jgi:transposase